MIFNKFFWRVIRRTFGVLLILSADLLTRLGLQMDSKIFNIIRYPIWKIIKIIQFISLSEKIRICIRIRIRKILTDMDTVWLLPIRNRPFSYYPSISDIIRRYPIRYYPILSEYLSEKISLCVFNYIFFCIYYKYN
jgi:hypothetical protein